jgi:hypothetical protein
VEYSVIKKCGGKADTVHTYHLLFGSEKKQGAKGKTQ